MMRKVIACLITACLVLSSCAVWAQEADTAAAGKWVDGVWTYTNSEGNEETLEYYLFVPSAWAEGVSLPMVTWIVDASGVGKSKETLLKNKAPIQWTKPDKQDGHPFFFLTINFNSTAGSVTDEYSPGGQTVKIIDHVVAEYGINEKKLYLTGQSMGGILDFQLNTLYPGKFAATYYVAAQPSADRTFQDDIAVWVLGEKAFLKQKICYMVSMLNEAAYTGQQKLKAAYDEAGISYVVLENLNRKSDTLNDELAKALQSDDGVFFFAYSKVASGNDTDEHNNTWRYAYAYDAIVDWMLAQELE